MRTYTGLINELPENGIFVFGSNTQGRHGAGTAKIAREKFGAIYGKDFGRQGQSFAIVTKDLTKEVHPSRSTLDVRFQILLLYHYAEDHPELDFYVAYTGKGYNLNGYTAQEMADMFNSFKRTGGVPENIIFEEEFVKLFK